MQEIRNLTDPELHQKVLSRVKDEREITTEVLHLLREVERRRVFVDHGCSTLFEYTVRCLKYDESAAHRRISAMRLLKELPELEGKIDSGELSLSVVASAQRLFKQEAKVERPFALSEKREVLKQLEGKSIRDADKVLLRYSTRPETFRADSVRAVSESHMEVRFVMPQETLEKLERIRGLLGHSHSEMTMAELLEAMARITLEKLDPAREPKRKRSSSGQAHGRSKESSQAEKSVAAPQPNETLRRYIGAALRREVWRRARGKCSHCRGLYRLQIDHIQPLAKGGTNDLQNLRLLCFHCNQRQADLKLGRERMERARSRAGSFRDSSSLPARFEFRGDETHPDRNALPGPPPSGLG